MTQCPDCRHPTPCMEGEEKCKYHVRQDEKQARKLKPIAHESEKRAKQNRQYRAECAVRRSEHHVCAGLHLIGITGVKCKGIGDTTQHLCGRIGDLLLDTKYQIPLCCPCHDWVNHNAKKAKELGLELSRHSIETESFNRLSKEA